MRRRTMTERMFRLTFQIEQLTPEQRQALPFPIDWMLSHEEMIRLVDFGLIGMDGFNYQFREFAEDCARRCGIHR